MKIQKIITPSIVVGLLFPLTLLAASATSPAPAPDIKAADAKTPRVPAAGQPSSVIPAVREFPLSQTELPCNDFHKYVCSEVESSFKLREDRRSHTFAFSDSEERLLEAQKKFMAEIPTRTDLDPRTAQARDTYLACMDKENSAKSERDEVKRLMTAMSGLKTPTEVLQFSHAGIPTEFAAFMAYGANGNVDDANKLDLYVVGSLMALPDHDYYKKDELMADYTTLLSHFFKIVYDKIDDTEAAKKAKAVVDLQRDFIKTYPLVAERRKRSSERRIMTQAEFIKKFPNVSPELFLKNIPKAAMVRLTVPESIEFFNNNLNKYPASVWKDFYIASSLEGLMDDAYPEFFQERFAFNNKHLGGAPARSERQERCTTAASDEFEMEVHAAMIDQIFPAFPEDQMQMIGKKIRESLLAALKTNTWLSKPAKAAAIKKITKLRLQLVRPHNDREWNFTPTQVLSPKDKIANSHLLGQARYAKLIKELSEPTNRDAWGMGPLTVNAYYDPTKNKFVVPIGILQYPFFGKQNSFVENLAAVGTVLGHEIGHGIDDNGSAYDADGKLHPWMSAKDLKEFKRRSQGLVDLFQKAGHNGALTLGENTGDLVGLTTSYAAAFPNGKGTIENKQKFFASYARLWCNVQLPGAAEKQLKTNPHALGWARINQQVKLQPGFIEAYSCKPGDAMYLPVNERVKVW